MEGNPSSGQEHVTYLGNGMQMLPYAVIVCYLPTPNCIISNPRNRIRNMSFSFFCGKASMLNV